MVQMGFQKIKNIDEIDENLDDELDRCDDEQKFRSGR